MVIRKFEKILIHITGWALGIYAMVILLFSLPAMQKNLANWTASILSNQLNTKVQIGSINIGLLNKFIINDVILYEPSGKKMATVARMAASVDMIQMLTGGIAVNTAQLFSANATLYKQTPDSAPNYQFLLDAFSQDEKEEPSKINICLNSLIMRHTNVTWDVKSEVIKPGTFDTNHISLRDCGMNLMVKCLTGDSLNCAIKRLQIKELNSGLRIKDSGLTLTGNAREAQLKEFLLQTPHSSVAIDSMYVNYANYQKDKKFNIGETNIYCNISPNELSPFIAKFSSFTQPLSLCATVSGNEKVMNISSINLSTDEGELALVANSKIHNVLSDNDRQINATIEKLFVSEEEIIRIAELIDSDEDKLAPLFALGDINYEGNMELDKNGVSSNGKFICGVGNVDYDMNLGNDKFLVCSITADSLDIGRILSNDKLASTSFEAEAALDLANKSEMPIGKISGVISSFGYNDYVLRNISIDALSTESSIAGKVDVDDENLVCSTEFDYNKGNYKTISASILIDKFVPHSMNLINDHASANLSFAADMKVKGIDFDHLYGDISIQKLMLVTPAETYNVSDILVTADDLGDRNKYTIESDIINGKIEGSVSLKDISQSIINQVSHHIPLLVKSAGECNATYDYSFTLNDSPILHHFADVDFCINEPIKLSGNVNTEANMLRTYLDAPMVSYSGTEYTDIAMTCNSTSNVMKLYATASTLKPSYDDDEPNNLTKLIINADVHNNKIVSDMLFDQTGRNSIRMNLLPTVLLSDSLGTMKTEIALQKSNAVINDTVWTAYPATVTLFKKSIECHGLKFANANNSSITVEGRASENPDDALITTLNDLEAKYILSIVNFDAVRFAGKVSGKAVVNNLMNDGAPDLQANLNVENFTLQEGSLGNAMIQANWDKDIDGIKLHAYFLDSFNVTDSYSPIQKKVTGITNLDGWVSPSKNDLRLNINTNNTNAAFLHGFLGGVFKSVSGTITGPLTLVGPMNDINLLGDAVPDLNVRLRATNVPYHITGDTLRLRPYLIEYKNATISDKYGNDSKIDAKITHKNFKNFTYDINAHMKSLCAYDETTFNSDKFFATVFADGELSVSGADGHPLYINADVTPTKGSVFAYDAATPDAITGNSFIEFADRGSLDIFPLYTENRYKDTELEKDSIALLKEAKNSYNSDIHLNINAHLTPACEVKLRMDNLDDGYMHTFGYADLTARWYNKGTFQLFGNYNINSGSYRLYLQDIIFRDLALQPGSQVEFNGNPFDANIHLLCHHAINSVPLSDLTNTTAFSSNNKVKVVCILDITGKLGNMDFKFDMDLPNVNEEVKQLVRSMINSEEEMNTQMIYLLGVGRFYPNEYARANGADNSGQVMNSLLSSTISGQINQMLSNVIGNNSNWNFGSSLTTGEKGWDDLDIEGILSGRLLDDRLLLNGNFGYRDNALTNQANFIGDFEVKWKMTDKGNLYLKGYNQTNDRYFTKATINTQGIGVSWQHDFETFRNLIRNSEATVEEKKKKDTGN